MNAPEISNSEKTKKMIHIVAIKGLRLAPVVFENHGDAIEMFEVHPELPLGLYITLENTALVLEGIPTQLSAQTQYAITARNAAGESTVQIDIAIVDALIQSQREAIMRVHSIRGDLDTPRSQLAESLSDNASMSSMIKPHEKFKSQPMGDDKRLSQQTEHNPDAENRAKQSPELTPSPSAKYQAQAKLAAQPAMTPKPGG